MRGWQLRILLLLIILSTLAAPAASKTTFGSETGTFLDLEDIRIFDVTGEQDKQTGGELVDSGLNKTFYLNQSRWRYYRFSFKMNNSGDTAWTPASEDELFHNGLDATWDIVTNDIWYNISGSEYHGGTFSSGKVSWDTSQGGTLSSDEVMYAKYLVNISADSSSEYSQRFEINDTSNSSGSYDSHELDLNNVGRLEVSIDQPPQETVVGQNRTFKLNGSVTCRSGECGEVYASARYNETSSADTLIPESSGEPFHTVNQNYKSCGNLIRDETCKIAWDLNATGTLESYHELDFNASSSTYTSISENDTEDRLVQINEVFLINVTWDRTDFGSLEPGKQNSSAQGNSNQKYNLTVEETSDSVDRLWTRASDLTSETDYRIGASNISYSLTNDISTEKRYSNSYSLVGSDIPAGEILNFFFWIDMPTGILQDDYSGTLYFKANNSG